MFWTESLSLRSGRVYPSSPPRQPSADRRTLPWRRNRRLFSFFVSFTIFSQSEHIEKLFYALQFLSILVRPGIDFEQFSVKKRIPGDYFFQCFFENGESSVILSKSCSRCGWIMILKGQTLQKSVRRATPNGNRKKKRQKPLPAPSPDALFRLRTRFLSILGSRPGPENRQKTLPKRVPK